MKKYWIVCFVISGVLFGFGNSGNTAGKIEEYSAEQVHISPDGKAAGAYKVHVAHQKMRMEMPAPWGKGHMITIVRRDKQVYWTLIPDQKVYIENMLDEAELQEFEQSLEENRKEEDLGTETVSGYKCRKKRVETTQEIMGQKIKTRVITWTSEKFDFPLRTQTEDGAITELRNIQKGRQPDKLFEVPSDYQKAKGMLDVMQRLRPQE